MGSGCHAAPSEMDRGNPGERPSLSTLNGGIAPRLRVNRILRFPRIAPLGSRSSSIAVLASGKRRLSTGQSRQSPHLGPAASGESGSRVCTVVTPTLHCALETGGSRELTPLQHARLLNPLPYLSSSSSCPSPFQSAPPLLSSLALIPLSLVRSGHARQRRHGDAFWLGGCGGAQDRLPQRHPRTRAKAAVRKAICRFHSYVFEERSVLRQLGRPYPPPPHRKRAPPAEGGSGESTNEHLKMEEDSSSSASSHNSPKLCTTQTSAHRRQH
ncbi:hypothetical protein SKAU_G00051390 [Synaphobranchus kaupii]|uniref:Uncharacterized protein n=1 Tax=Synaphobranchus kaupii TaxID=118154 RepID=A0A9Q1G443_SYNKA|nr:hypothetical protein SKAU_G00051390 [Synaphobranchus kaupii]